MWSFDIYLVTFTTVDIQKSYIGCHRENIWLERGIYTQIIRYMILNFIQNDSLLHEYFLLKHQYGLIQMWNNLHL